MTRVLDLDCGNSRTKWRCDGSHGIVSRGCIPCLDHFPDRVRVSSVSNSHEELRSEITQSYGVEPEFARSTKTLAGVTNSYVNPDELGVDRWLAMVAAWNKVKTATMVVDAGTAITIDIVGDAGEHLGGYIVPGFDSMRKSLGVDTAQVQINSIDEIGADCRLGNDTKQAVYHGLLSMVVYWINQTRLRAEEICGVIPTTFLAGGDRRILTKVLEYECRNGGELVLDGLDLALP